MTLQGWPGRALMALAPVIAGTLMTLAVVLANGRPVVFPDTDDYFKNGRIFAESIAYATHLQSPPPTPTDAKGMAEARYKALRQKAARQGLEARSPFYGLFLFTSQKLNGLWTTTTIQAAIAAWLVFLLWRTLAPGAPRWTAYAAQGATAFGSTLPFFAGFAMPDIFAGYVALGVMLLLIGWDRLKAWERAALAVLLGFCTTVHGSHGLIILGLLGVGALGSLMVKAPPRRLVLPLLVIAAALAGGMAANAIYMKSVQIQTGDKPGRPPFLAVRLLADGPGRHYLRWACENGETYALCRFRNLPLNDSDQILWSSNPKLGVFNRARFSERTAFEAEQTRFAIETVRYDPGGVLVSSLKNWGRLLTGVHVTDPLTNPRFYVSNKYWRRTNLPWLIDQGRDCGPTHNDCQSRLKPAQSKWLHGGLFLLALAAIAGRMGLSDTRALWRRRRLDLNDPAARLAAAVILMAAALLINALVCGAVSGPFARYQARIVWVVTALAACALAPLAAREARTPMVALARRLWGLRPTWLGGDAPRFALVGAAGFIVDRLVLEAAIQWGGLDYFTGRLVSFSVAVGATWLLNRSFTFRHPHSHPPLRQALIYAGVQGAGGLLNIGCYTAAILLVPALKAHLLLPLAIGSAAGLCVTYLGSKHLAFRRAATSVD